MLYSLGAGGSIIEAGKTVPLLETIQCRTEVLRLPKGKAICSGLAAR